MKNTARSIIAGAILLGSASATADATPVNFQVQDTSNSINVVLNLGDQQGGLIDASLTTTDQSHGNQIPANLLNVNNQLTGEQLLQAILAWGKDGYIKAIFNSEKFVSGRYKDRPTEFKERKANKYWKGVEESFQDALDGNMNPDWAASLAENIYNTYSQIGEVILANASRLGIGGMPIVLKALQTGSNIKDLEELEKLLLTSV